MGLTIFGTEFFACKCDLCDLLFIIWFWCVVCLLLLLHINLLKLLTFDYDYPIKLDTIILSVTSYIYTSDFLHAVSSLISIPIQFSLSIINIVALRLNRWIALWF